jgi:hypothetical protein
LFEKFDPATARICLSWGSTSRLTGSRRSSRMRRRCCFCGFSAWFLPRMKLCSSHRAGNRTAPLVQLPDYVARCRSVARRPTFFIWNVSSGIAADSQPDGMLSLACRKRGHCAILTNDLGGERDALSSAGKPTIRQRRTQANTGSFAHGIDGSDSRWVKSVPLRA